MRRVLTCAFLCSTLTAFADDPSHGRAQNPDREPPHASVQAADPGRGRNASPANQRWLPLYESFRQRERSLVICGLAIEPPVRINAAVDDDAVTLSIVDAAGASLELEIGSGKRDEKGIPLEALAMRDAQGRSHAVAFSADGPAIVALLQSWRDDHAQGERTRRVRLTEMPQPGSSTMQLTDWVTQLANALMGE